MYVVSCLLRRTPQFIPRASRRHASTPTMSPRPPFTRIHWVLDWDGTITRRDTLQSLVTIAAACKPEVPVMSQWERLSKDYMAEYAQDWEELTGGGMMPKTVEEESALLHALTATEMRSLNRVSVSGIFSGLTGQHLDEGAANVIEARHVELRAGYTEFASQIRLSPGDVFNILSVNWSRRFIAGCLRAAGGGVEPGLIYANELEGVEAGRKSNGELLPEGGMHIVSSADKVRYLNQLKHNQTGGEAIPVVYVGDSRPDIECLIAADLGICIRDDPMGSSQKALAEDLQRLQIQCPHIQEWKQADEWKVVWARDFCEIRAWVDSLEGRA